MAANCWNNLLQVDITIDYYNNYVNPSSLRLAAGLSMNIQQWVLLIAASTLPRMAVELCDAGTHTNVLERVTQLVDALIRLTIHYVNS